MSIEVALYVGDPSSPAGREADYDGYKRAKWDGYVLEGRSMSRLIEFPRCAGGLNRISHVGIMGHDGSLIMGGAIDHPLQITADITPRFDVGALSWPAELVEL